MKNSFIILLLSFPIIFNSPIALGQNDNQTLLVINNEEVFLEDFEYLYQKNYQNEENVYSKKSLEEYLELFVNFKLKVFEGRRLELDKQEKFRQEFESYRKQLAKPYLTDKEFSEELIEATYERIKQEVDASHILFKLRDNPRPEDTLLIYNKAIDLKKRIENGESFEKLAIQLSDDPSAKQNNGRLGYFTALQMVYPFEDAAYNTPVGRISNPVRTQFGYHLIKVHDKRLSKGEVRVAHIMVGLPKGFTPEDSLNIYNKANEIYKQISEGADWKQMCSEFSDDTNTKNIGGELPWFSSGRMFREFAEAAFALKDSGDISQPVKTPFGWHIIQLLEKKPVEPFETLKPSLKRRIASDSRSKVTQRKFIEKLKTDNQFSINESIKEQVLTSFDTTLIQGTWSYDTQNALNAQTLFSINNEKFSAKDFFDFVKSKQSGKTNFKVEEYAQILYKQYEEKSLLDYEEAHLTEKYSDYKFLVQEYEEGMIFFDVMEKHIWNPSIQDSVGLKAFFEANRENYQWKERAKAHIFSLNDKKALENLKELLASDKYENPVLYPEIVEIMNSEAPLTIQYENGTYEMGDNKLLDAKKWSVGSFETKSNGRFIYVLIEEILESRLKELDETRGMVISDYQKKLEAEWLSELKKKYKIKVEDKVLEQLIK